MEIALAKLINCPSIIVITKKMENLGNPTFGFDFISHEEKVKVIDN